MTVRQSGQAGIELPCDIKLVYHAEGGANIVYNIESTKPNGNEPLPSEISNSNSSTPPPTELESWEVDLPNATDHEERFEGKLLRLRKDKGHVLEVWQAQQDFHNHIVPLFEPNELIGSTAVKLNPELINNLNTELQSLEITGKRAIHRSRIYLRQEGYGTLVDDAGYNLLPSEIKFEMKPKWLAQSLDAPKNARRCRTCALRALRRAKRYMTGKGNVNDKLEFCPLALASGNRALIARALEHYLKKTIPSSSIRSHIIDYFTQSNLLQKLKSLQSSLYTKGVLKADPSSVQFLTVMTLRDCSLFLRVTPNGVTSARLADLDLKSPLRAEYWRELENTLIKDGWYTRPSSRDDHVRCALETDTDSQKNYDRC